MTIQRRFPVRLVQITNLISGRQQTWSELLHGPHSRPERTGHRASHQRQVRGEPSSVHVLWTSLLLTTCYASCHIQILLLRTFLCIH